MCLAIPWRSFSRIKLLKATVPILAFTEATAEIVARIGGEQAARGINLPLGDLIIGASALQLGCRRPKFGDCWSRWHTGIDHPSALKISQVFATFRGRELLIGVDWVIPLR